MNPTPSRCLRTPISDLGLSPRAFMVFSTVRALPGGRVLRFEYPVGLSYDVPVPYVVSWFSQPHYRRAGRRWRPASSSWPHGFTEAVALRTRLMLAGSVACVYLSNSCAVEVAWDTVLMACEPAYEHFGGLTPSARAITLRYWKEWLDTWFAELK